MKRITRRDFINGTLMAAGASLLPWGCANERESHPLDANYYPPSLTGLRGSHPGSNTHSHSLAWTNKKDWGSTAQLKEQYDLIVVGGGISGLSAAYFYQQAHGKDKRVLIVDNHDDFGGHARRNEHMVNGQLRLGHGGSQSIVRPNEASKEVQAMFNDLGIEPQRFNTAYNSNFYTTHNLGAVTYFNKAVFGEDRVVKHPFCNYPNYIQGIIMNGKVSNEDAVQQTPLSSRGKEQLLKVLNGGLHLFDMPVEKLEAYLSATAYFDYLKSTLGVDDPGVLRMARHSGLDWASSGTDVMSMDEAMSCGAMGFAPRAVYDEEVPYIYHFPDGNATIARALVKKLIPRVATGDTAEELILSTFDYSQLDRSKNTVRIRLNSTVVNARHSEENNMGNVLVTYINDNKAYQVNGKKVVMACYNMMIPYIIPDLPKEQSEALRLQSKSPIQYSTLGLKNWKAFKALEIGMAMCPGNMHQAVFMDFPVSIGGYEYTKTSKDPCVIQMIHCPYGETMGAPVREQYREARYRMLSLKFEDYENEIRSHLTGMLPAALFEFDRDVESITVNRWGHGYTVGGPKGSVINGRQPFGSITIANCDSAPAADAKAAIDMAARAVKELG